MTNGTANVKTEFLHLYSDPLLRQFKFSSGGPSSLRCLYTLIEVQLWKSGLIRQVCAKTLVSKLTMDIKVKTKP